MDGTVWIKVHSFRILDSPLLQAAISKQHFGRRLRRHFSRTGTPIARERKLSIIKHTSGCSVTTPASGQPWLRSNCLPSSCFSCTEPPKEFKKPMASRILFFESDFLPDCARSAK